jgi:predicted nucleotidyltransferase
MALSCGIDLVIELPTLYATSSAEYFASGSIALLNDLGIIDNISFGNKCNNIDTLFKIANYLYNEPLEYQKILQNELKKGISFPTARSNALRVILRKEIDEKMLSEILLDSNNILGIEYIKALILNKSKIQPVSIERLGCTYNSTDVTGDICSATAIRKMFRDENINDLSKVVPKEVYEIISNELAHGKGPIFESNFEKEILYALRVTTASELTKIADITEGLENIIKKCSNEHSDINVLIDMIKSKRYTQTRIQRILLHILLNITKEEIEKYKHSPQYIRILGFNKVGEKLLSKIASASRLPIVTSVNKFMKIANVSQKEMIEKDILATNIYSLGYQIPSLKIANLDYMNNVVTI